MTKLWLLARYFEPFAPMALSWRRRRPSRHLSDAKVKFLTPRRRRRWPHTCRRDADFSRGDTRIAGLHLRLIVSDGDIFSPAYSMGWRIDCWRLVRDVVYSLLMLVSCAFIRASGARCCQPMMKPDDARRCRCTAGMKIPVTAAPMMIFFICRRPASSARAQGGRHKSVDMRRADEGRPKCAQPCRPCRPALCWQDVRELLPSPRRTQEGLGERLPSANAANERAPLRATAMRRRF